MRESLREIQTTSSINFSPIVYPLKPKSGPLSFDFVTNKPVSTISSEVKSLAKRLFLKEQKIGYCYRLEREDLNFFVNIECVEDFSDFSTISLEILMANGIKAKQILYDFQIELARIME